MALYTVRSGNRPRPLGDIPRDAFDAWLKTTRRDAAAERGSFNSYPRLHPERVRAVNRDLSTRRFGGYTNVIDPLLGFQEKLIAQVIGDAGALRYAGEINAGQETYNRLKDDYTLSVHALAAYTGGNADRIWGAGEDQDAVIRAALSHL